MEINSFAFRVPFFLHVLYSGAPEAIFSFIHTQQYGEAGELSKIITVFSLRLTEIQTWENRNYLLFLQFILDKLQVMYEGDLLL